MVMRTKAVEATEALARGQAAFRYNALLSGLALSPGPPAFGRLVAQGFFL